MNFHLHPYLHVTSLLLLPCILVSTYATFPTCSTMVRAFSLYIWSRVKPWIWIQNHTVDNLISSILWFGFLSLRHMLLPFIHHGRSTKNSLVDFREQKITSFSLPSLSLSLMVERSTKNYLVDFREQKITGFSLPSPSLSHSHGRNGRKISPLRA